MDPMGTWSNLSFPLVLIFDILLLHFGNICCALPTAHPESNKLRHESSQVLEVGMVTLWNSLEQKSFFINKNPNGRDTFRVLWSQQISPTPQKKHKTNPQRKISVLASLEPPLQKKKHKNARKNGPHLDRGIFFGDAMSGNISAETNFVGDGESKKWHLELKDAQRMVDASPWFHGQDGWKRWLLKRSQKSCNVLTACQCKMISNHDIEYLPTNFP